MSHDGHITNTLSQHTLSQQTRKAEGDFVVILSSEMISDIVQQYFNDEMYKRQVEVVDTKATETGYAFSVAWYCGHHDGKEAVKQQVDMGKIDKQHKEVYERAMHKRKNGEGRHVQEEKDGSKVTVS